MNMRHYHLKAKVLLWPLLILLTILFTADTHAGISQYWRSSNETSVQVIDHSPWQKILDSYLITNTADGVNRFNYKKVSLVDKAELKQYLIRMQRIDPHTYNRAQQKAYWINLYNALTVKLVLDNYPIKSIKKLGKGLFSFGPWDDDIATINGKKLSLNDIEHKILRPLWKDPRIHYAVNCASYGCPNLAAQAFTAKNTEQLLQQGAHNYINHPRGVTVKRKKLLISSIYKWYLEDFGGDKRSLLAHLKAYAEPELKEQLNRFDLRRGDINHRYDWRLNQPE